MANIKQRKENWLKFKSSKMQTFNQLLIKEVCVFNYYFQDAVHLLCSSVKSGGKAIQDDREIVKQI